MRQTDMKTHCEGDSTAKTRPRQRQRPVVKHAAKDLEGIRFAAVMGSELTCWHRPKLQHLTHLESMLGITLVATAQSERECAADVGRGCRRAGIKWIHVPLEGANRALLSAKKKLKLTLDALALLYKAMASGGERVLLHCAAGIHRTGVCAYSLLRCSGEYPTRASAMTALRSMRQVTSSGVKDWRIDLAEEILVPGLAARVGQARERLQQLPDGKTARGGGLEAQEKGEKKDAPACVWVHLVRHGEVDNPKRIFYGRLPGFGLTGNGRRQAARVGAWLKERVQAAGTRVASSPMQRARETAAIVRRALGVSAAVQVVDDITEIRSPFEGKNLSVCESIGWDIYDEKHMATVGGNKGNSEAFEDAADRVIAAVRNFARQAANAASSPGAIVAMSHGDCCLAARLWGSAVRPTREARSKVQKYPSHCSVTSLRVRVADGSCLEMSVKDWDD